MRHMLALLCNADILSRLSQDIAVAIAQCSGSGQVKDGNWWACL
jgi:hypothetical protein